jgi:arylsulfatase A-like enzyme
LAAQTFVAERWSGRETVLFGSPGAEPYQAEGFYAEARKGPSSAGYLWARSEAELAFDWAQVEPRAAVVELSPYPGLREQSAEVRLNGTPVGRLVLNDARHRYRLSLPAAAQKPGDNRLRFVFAASASPSEADPGSGDTRHLAAAFYTLSVGREGDASLDDLLRRDAPGPFDVTAADGVPSLTMPAPSVVRYAVRLPAAAELRFTPELHPQARAAAGAASFRVTVEGATGGEREVYSRIVRASERAAREESVSLPGAAGDIVRVGLAVGGAPATRFAWGVWRAPRVVGRGAAARLQPAPLAPDDARRGDALRRALQGRNVVLVILDAARARQFGAYGYGRATTPEIDRIAREGVVFERAYTPAVYTLSAMSSLWTSQYPDRHHGDMAFSSPLPGDRFTLAELLSARGVRTAGFVANAMAGRAFGLHQGFGEFRELFRDLGSDAAVFAQVLPGWLRAHKHERFFAYLHFREPHFPYDPPAPFDTAFGPDGPIPKELRRSSQFIVDVNQGRRTLTPDERDHLVRLYDGNLASADREIGRLRAALEAEGLWDKTVVIVAADHGEGLLEHGFIGHNTQLYDESVHVPLIVRLPGGTGPSGARVPALVDLLDVAPTIADVFGLLDQPDARKNFQGRSLLAVIGGAPGKPAVLSRTVWDRPRYALRDARFKFVYDTRTGAEELYDVQADPGETRNVVAGEPLRAAFYRQELHQWVAGLAQTGSAEGAGAAAQLSREQCENLKSLGYLPSDFKCPEE